MIRIKPKSTPYTLYNILYLIYTKGYKISPFQTYKAEPLEFYLGVLLVFGPDRFIKIDADKGRLFFNTYHFKV